MASRSRELVLYNSNEEQQLPLPVATVSPSGKRVVPHTTYGPGRLLNQMYISVGQSIEKRANRLAHKAGLGPIAVIETIEKAFEMTSEERLAILDNLHDRVGSADRDDIKLRDLQKYCMKLMKYALP